jgi:hypothetical protein
MNTDLRGSASSDLSGPRRFQSQATRGRLEFVRRGGAFLFEQEPLILFEQLLALVAQGLVLITVLHGSEVLLRSENKPAGEYKTTEQQQAETRERSNISRAANLCVELMLRKSFHDRFPSLRNLCVLCASAVID